MGKFDFGLFPQYSDFLKIGKGGFATVYSAIYQPAAIRVAIKFVPKEKLDTELNQRNFHRELEILKKVDHPFIAHFFDVIESEDAFYIIMELASNGTLLSRLNTSGELSTGEVKKIFAQLISVLYYLHNEVNIIHRDIKLENILFDDSGNVKLIDFGLSCAMKTSADTFHTLCGSYPYAAPEIFQRIPYGMPIDIWSLGVCMFAAVAGRLPFSQANTTKLIKAIVSDEPEYPDTLPSMLEVCLKAMLQKEPESRIKIEDLVNHPFFSDSPIKFYMTEQRPNVTPTQQTGLDPEIATKMVRLGMDPLKSTILGTEEATYYRIVRSAKVTQLATEQFNRRPIVPILKKGSAPTVPAISDRALGKSVNKPNVISLDALPPEALRFRRSSITRNVGSHVMPPQYKRDSPLIMRPVPGKHRATGHRMFV